MKYAKCISILLAVAILLSYAITVVLARGRPGGGGAIAGGLSGGGARPSVGGGAAAVSRPNVGGGNIGGGNVAASRPNVSAPARPAQPVSRPAINNSLPSFSGSNLGGSSLGNLGVGTRPSLPVNLPSGLEPGQRPQIGINNKLPGGAIVGTLPANPGGRLPTVGNTLPGSIGDRLPSVGNTLPGNINNRLPGNVADRLPGNGTIGNQLPGHRPENPRFPGLADQRPAVLPGLGGDRPRWDAVNNNHKDWVNNTRSDLSNRLDNRQDFLNDWQNNRHDFLNDRREDWQNWANDRHYWHNDWCHGNWHGNWGGYWEHLWAQHPVWAAFGVTRWALNTASYLFGTGYYYNPYYTAVPVTQVVYDYSQPIVMYSDPNAAARAGTADSDLPPGVSDAGLATFDQARAAFQQGDYPRALQFANAAVKEMPQDALLHEFRALCLFAVGDYHNAAAVLNAVLAVGPGWDWTTMSSLYPTVDDYTAQLRNLEQYLAQHPAAADARFVLAYQYLTMGYDDRAAQQLAQVVKLQPDDEVARQLYAMLTYKAPDDAPPQIIEPPAPTAHLSADDLAGVWNATGGTTTRSTGNGDTIYNLSLTKDGAFTWKYTKGRKTQSVSGAYAIDGTTLAMEPEAGGVMLADLTPQGKDAMQFKMIGGGENDLLPLDFRR